MGFIRRVVRRIFARNFMGFLRRVFAAHFCPKFYRVFAAGCAAENRASIARGGCGGFSPNICGVFAAGCAANFPRDSMGFCARGGGGISRAIPPTFSGIRGRASPGRRRASHVTLSLYGLSAT